MKLRYFLRGLGAGIVFTVLVLGISGSNTEKEALTDNEIMARARELGMVTKDEKLDESLSQMLENQQRNEEADKEGKEPEEDKASDTEAEDTKASDAKVNEPDSEEAEEPEEAKEPETEEESKEAPESSKEEQASQELPEAVVPEPLEEEQTQVISKLTISRGMGSKQVSAALKQLGIIENAEAFDSYLCSNGYSSRICTGTFTIEGKPEYHELARIITTKN